MRQVGFEGSNSGGGRPARLIEFNADSAAYLGVEFGLHKTKIAVADGRGGICAVVSKPAAAGDPQRTMQPLKQLVVRALKKAGVPRSRVQAVGATVPGLIDQNTGICRLAPNLGWRNFPLRDALETLFQQQVVVTNITQAAAVAEGRLGAAQGVNSFVWLYLGAGVGAGIVSDGRPFEGTRGFAGEIGHCRIADEDVPCGCGEFGHFEAFASTMAILDQARILAARHPRSQLAHIRLDDIGSVLDAARSGDAVARRLLERVASYVGKGCAVLVNLLDTQQIVLGGDLAAAGDYFVRAVEHSIRENALVADAVGVVNSALEDRAGLLGSVLLAMDRSRQSYRLVADAHYSRVQRR